jgi:hypothetical protein
VHIFIGVWCNTCMCIVPLPATFEIDFGFVVHLDDVECKLGSSRHCYLDASIFAFHMTRNRCRHQCHLVLATSIFSLKGQILG